MKSMYIINKTCFRCVQSRGNWWGVIKNNSAQLVGVGRNVLLDVGEQY